MKIIINEDLIQTDVIASTQNEIFEQLAKPLYDLNLVNEGFLEGVRRREQNFPTGLPTEPFGVAIPHTDPEYVKQNAISVGVLRHPVTFTVMGTDDEITDVRVVFLLALNESQKQLNILKSITELIRDAKQLEKLLSCDSTEIYKILDSKLKGEI